MSEIPDYVEKCELCEGTGEREQTYNHGCGGGMYRSVGPCDYCAHPKFYMRGIGYRMKDKSDMPMSVINQLEVAGVLISKKSPYSEYRS